MTTSALRELTWRWLTNGPPLKLPGRQVERCSDQEEDPCRAVAQLAASAPMWLLPPSMSSRQLPMLALRCRSAAPKTLDCIKRTWGKGKHFHSLFLLV